MEKHLINNDSDLALNKDTDLESIVQKSVSRRGFLQGTAATMGMFLAATPLAQAIAGATKTPTGSKLIGFKGIPASTADTFVVPQGYVAEPLISWGDPIVSGAPAFDESGMQDSAAQAGQFGDNTDGMSIFPLSEDRALLAVNNEYTNYQLLFAHGGKDLTADDVKKAQAAHGVSVFEIQKNANGTWNYLKDSKYNRRITANTEMELTGPVAGHDLVKTSVDPMGKKVLGTFNNCANGQTPWGTYLTCEENFHGYFGSDSEVELSPRQKRYGLKAGKKNRYNWFKHDARFDLAKEPQESNRHGWVVEIDPMDPTSTPKKRTALGRFKHENAALTVNGDGHVVVYLGDDERGEHLYKFVSKGKVDTNNTAANRELLAEGTLYVAHFDAEEGEMKGKGEWVELTYGKNGLDASNGFADQADVLVHTREAATVVGATTMDRPEWVAVHPENKAVFCTLTNNKHRGNREDQPLNGPNPRIGNKYGQILRWWPTNADHSGNTFTWDLLVIAGNPDVHPGTLNAGSANITNENMFNSPDGIGFDKTGRLWIQTDGNYSNAKDFAGMGNNQMLCGDPETGEIVRFATGPIACEITGLAFSEDQRTVFVGVQHPGEKGKPSHFPAGGNSKPRSTIMVV
ncbi:MAG: PhoX family protein, partial [Pontibacterium sp.]